MATTVLGASPVTFISEDTEPGTQFQIPLTALTVTSAGAVDAGAWTPPNVSALSANDAKVVAAVLTDLQARGVLWTTS